MAHKKRSRYWYDDDSDEGEWDYYGDYLDEPPKKKHVPDDWEYIAPEFEDEPDIYVPPDDGDDRDDEADYGEPPGEDGVHEDEEQVNKWLYSKYADTIQGGFVIPVVITPNASIRRLEWSAASIPKGLDSNNRIGDRIYANRITLRFAIWLNQNTVQGGTFPELQYRFFLYIDKEKQYGATLPGGVGNANFISSTTFQQGGFLQYDRMNSFYDRSEIRGYRILYDSGLEAMKVVKGAEEFPYGAQGGAPIANGVAINGGNHYLNQANPLGTVIVSDNDFGTDQVFAEGLVNPHGIINLVAAAPAGVGTIDGIWNGDAILNNLSFAAEKVRARTTITDGNTEFAGTTLYNQNLTRISMWKALPNTRSYEMTYDLNGLLINYPSSDAVPYFNNPTKNDVRFGLIVYSPVFQWRYAVDMRLDYDDC